MFRCARPSHLALYRVYPAADIPVVQLSIDGAQPVSFHHEIGKRIALLREEGVLIVGSGNLVHNLHAYAWGRHTVEPCDWAVAFEKRVREYCSRRKPTRSSTTRTGSAERLVACRSECVTADAAGGVRVFPLDRPSMRYVSGSKP